MSVLGLNSSPFFFNDTATTEIYTLSLHDALPILKRIEILKKNHIPCAEFGSATNINEAKNVAQNIGYPVVIKPIDNAGSRGVIQIKNSEKMEQYFDESIQFCKNKKEIIK